jgi:hypothetical protein
MDRGQLLRAQDAEGLEQLGPDLVLAAVAAREVRSAVSRPRPRLSCTSTPLFSSSGCAVT